MIALIGEPESITKTIWTFPTKHGTSSSAFPVEIYNTNWFFLLRHPLFLHSTSGSWQFNPLPLPPLDRVSWLPSLHLTNQRSAQTSLAFRKEFLVMESSLASKTLALTCLAILLTALRSQFLASILISSLGFGMRNTLQIWRGSSDCSHHAPSNHIWCTARSASSVWRKRRDQFFPPFAHHLPTQLGAWANLFDPSVSPV